MKASGSLGNLVQGVSQQAPHERREGQLTEMVNMLPDPVKGLARRHGSHWLAEINTGMPVGNLQAMLEDTKTWRHFEYSNAGREYVILYRSTTRPAGSTLPSMYVFNKTNNVFLTIVKPAVDTVLGQFESGGCSAITAIGKYLFAAGHSIIPSATTTDVWGSASNQDKAVVWVRGGGYSRTFKVTAVKTDNTTVSFEYTTPKSSYSGVLDTSTVPQLAADPAGGTDTRTEGAYITLVGGLYQHTLTWAKWTPTALTVKKGTTAMTNVSPSAPASSTEFSWGAGAATVVFHSSNLGATDVTVNYTSVKTIVNPNYAQIVTQLTNEYNSAVTKHIGDAAEAIQPQAIAEQLKLAALAAGLSTATRFDSTVAFSGVKSISTQDGGDGSLIRGVANEVASADQVSNLHIIGKVVKVRARGSEEAYYLKAVPKDTTVVSGYAEVAWVEGAGITYQIDNALIFGTAVGNTFYMASSSALLDSILPGSEVPPTYDISSVGDNLTSPLPYFIGRKITYLGVFQDRLLIGSGGVLRASRIGDYLNFFRSSVLTAPANDALEMLSQGSEDDELRHSVLYDRDLVPFGAKRQYAISGRSALAPANANMPVMSNHEGAGDVPPVAAGGVIFYSKQGQSSPSVHEIRPGTVAESPESYSVSSQLTAYFRGKAVEVVVIAQPAMLFMRTEDARDTLYTFSYLDTNQGRRQDAWGKWVFNADLGAIVGVSGTGTGPLVFTLRVSHDTVWIVADVCPVSAELSTYPYLDSMRPYSAVASGIGSVRDDTPGSWAAVFDGSTEYKFLGDSLAGRLDLINDYPAATGVYVGAQQAAYFTPTNPYVKDRKEQAILTGRLTITGISLTFSDSSGFNAVVTHGEQSSVTDFNGLIMGNPNALIGRVPITSGNFNIPVGRETREYACTVNAKSWLPLTVTSIDWVGQFFNNTQRLG